MLSLGALSSAPNSCWLATVQIIQTWPGLLGVRICTNWDTKPHPRGWKLKRGRGGPNYLKEAALTASSFLGGTNTNHRRLVRVGAPSNGAFLFGVAMETSDFFQTEAERCKDNAQKATRKADRDFWLNLANRWETMHWMRKHEPNARVVPVEHRYNRKPFRAA
jgi:hypothetical protein